MMEPRQLLILDEAHNLERKMLLLSSHNLEREYVSTKFGIDIFEALMKREKYLPQAMPVPWNRFTGLSIRSDQRIRLW